MSRYLYFRALTCKSLGLQCVFVYEPTAPSPQWFKHLFWVGGDLTENIKLSKNIKVFTNLNIVDLNVFNMKPPALCNHLVQCILQAVHRRTTKECFEQRRAAREPTELGRTGLRVPLALQEKLGLYDSGTSSFSGSLPRLSLGQYLFVSLKRQQQHSLDFAFFASVASPWRIGTLKYLEIKI